MLTWGDTFSDYWALWLLRKRPAFAVPMLILLVFANVVQAAMTYTLPYTIQRGPLAVVAALLGLKPLVEGFQIVFGIDDAIDVETAAVGFAISRTGETGAESIPQVILQALAIAAQGAAKVSAGQIISIGWSILNIAHSFVDVSFMIDTAKTSRVTHPSVNGYIEDKRETAMALALGLFGLGYTSAKLIAVATMGGGVK